MSAAAINEVAGGVELTAVPPSGAFGRIAAALAKAQGEIKSAEKDRANPHFGSKYATLSSVRDACNGPLSKNGIAVVQPPSVNGKRVTVRTLLLHVSGEQLECTLEADARDSSPQAIGSVITYLRRYGLSSMAGVAPEDDDAEAGQSREPSPAQRQYEEKRARRDDDNGPAGDAALSLARVIDLIASARALGELTALQGAIKALPGTSQQGPQAEAREHYAAAKRRIEKQAATTEAREPGGEA